MAGFSWRDTQTAVNTTPPSPPTTHSPPLMELEDTRATSCGYTQAVPEMSHDKLHLLDSRQGKKKKTKHFSTDFVGRKK